MVGTVIETSNVDPSLVFRQSMNTFNNSDTMAYLKTNASKVYDVISNSGSIFASTIKNIYGDIRDNIGMQKAKNVIANVNIFVRDDMVQPRTMDNIHESGMMNRQYIMAEPSIFELYQNNRIDGFGDMVVNSEPDIAPEWRYDHLDSIDGIATFTTDGMEIINTSTEYENLLSVDDVFVIQSLRETALAMMANGVDPTNPIEGSEL